MKKVLLSLFTVLFAVSAMAQKTVEFVAGTDVSANSSAVDNDVVSKDGISITVSNGVLGRTDNYRCYKGKTLTVSCSSGTITSVVFTCTASKDAQYGPGCFTDPTSGAYSFEDKVGTWTGSASEFTLTASVAQVRMTNILVTYTPGDGGEVGNVISAPSFSLASGEFDSAQELTITAAEGYGLIYTLDGETPADGVGEYVTSGSATITISKTTTVKAISVDNDDPDNASSVKSVTITINQGPINTPETAITPSKANELAETGESPEAYVKGVICNIKSLNTAKYTNAQYYIKESAESADSFYIYNGLYLEGKNFTSDEQIKVGDEVIVFGKLIKYVDSKNGTTTLEMAAGNHIYSLNGNTKAEEDHVEQIEHVSVKDFLAKADANTRYELTGVVTSIANASYGNLYIAEGTDTIYVYGVADLEGKKQNFGSLNVAVNDTLTITGVYGTYKDAPQVVEGRFVSVKKAEKQGDDIIVPDVTQITLAEFTNGGFEAWTEKKADQWTPATTAGGATVSQNEDAHSGSSSILVKGATSNKRIATTEIALEAGCYTLTVYAKAEADTAKVRPGYVPVKVAEDGKSYETLSGNSYIYFTDAVEVYKSWTEVKNTFILEEPTIISVVIMNPKNSGNVLIDDVELRVATDEEKEVATGISNIATAKDAKEVFNLAGQRLAAPHKGINIIGGKKVYVK